MTAEQEKVSRKVNETLEEAKELMETLMYQIGYIDDEEFVRIHAKYDSLCDTINMP